MRLADVDTPEVGKPGADEATDYLTSLLYRRLVYPDIEDLSGVDAYGRIIAVVYVRYDATHLLNVNEACSALAMRRFGTFPTSSTPLHGPCS